HPGLAPLAAPSRSPDRAGERTTVDLSCLLLPVCEQHPQAAPRVKHFRSDRSLGNSEDRGDLTVRVAFDVEQHYRQAPPLGQLGERLAQPLVQRPPLGRRVGARARRARRTCRRGRRGAWGTRPAPRPGGGPARMCSPRTPGPARPPPAPAPSPCRGGPRARPPPPPKTRGSGSRCSRADAPPP